MKRLVAMFAVAIVFLAGCSTATSKSTAMTFDQKDQDYQISTPSNYPKYQELETELAKYKLTPDSKVAALTTSTANILYEAGANIVAAPQSRTLNPELQKLQDSKKVANIGSALEPNIEVLLTSEPDIVFIADSMPHTKENEAIENLIYLPQRLYTDIFITLELLDKSMDLPNTTKLMNDMVAKDQAIKQDMPKNVKNPVAALQYSEGALYVASPENFVGSLLTELNIENAYADYPDVNVELSVEQLLLDNPEYIVIYGHGSTTEQLTEFMSNEKMQSLDAVKNNKVIILDKISASSDLSAVDSLEVLVGKFNEANKK